MHGFASVGNLYQKMHFAGSNPDTASKRAKGIYETPKKCRGEKTGEISRNLPFSRFSSFGSKLTCHHGRPHATLSEHGMSVKSTVFEP